MNGERIDWEAEEPEAFFHGAESCRLGEPRWNPYVNNLSKYNAFWAGWEAAENEENE